VDPGEARVQGRVRGVRRDPGAAAARAEAPPARGRRRHEPSGLRRAARYGNGWYGFALDLDATRRAIEGCARPSSASTAPALGKLEITIPPPGRIDREAAHGYAALGVDRLVLLGRGRNVDEALAAVELAERDLVRPLAS
jgi:hypothetical protein